MLGFLRPAISQEGGTLALGSRSSSRWVEQRSPGTLLPCMHTDGWIIPRDSEGSPAVPFALPRFPV